MYLWTNRWVNPSWLAIDYNIPAEADIINSMFYAHEVDGLFKLNSYTIIMIICMFFYI